MFYSALRISFSFFLFFIINKSFSQNRNETYKSKAFEDYLYCDVGFDAGKANENGFTYGILANAECFGITGSFHYRKVIYVTDNGNHDLFEKSGSLGYRYPFSDFLKISFSAGIGQTNFECRGASSFECKDYKSEKVLCYPLNLDLILIPDNGYFGFGINCFGNYNKRQNYYGATVNIRLFFVKPER